MFFGTVMKNFKKEKKEMKKTKVFEKQDSGY